MKNNLFIKETFVNESENCIVGEADWYETFTDNLSELYKSLRKEYGRPRKMYRELKEGDRQVGWIFGKNDRYQDTGEKYKRSVWIEIALSQPEQTITWKIERPTF